MDINKKLADIWNSDYLNSLPPFIKERGYAYADNVKKDILITGFNPSFREGEQVGVIHGPICNIWNNPKYDNYWGPVRKILSEGDLDLKDNADYLDIFYFREMDQKIFKNEILSRTEGVRFAAEQLNVTMHIVEDVIRPKLIVVKNKEAAAYWGRLFDEKGLVWMGYRFEHIQNMECGELCRITGLIDSDERIAPEIKETNIIGSFVLFSKHINQYTSLNERPTPLILKSILDWYNAEQYVKTFAL